MRTAKNLGAKMREKNERKAKPGREKNLWLKTSLADSDRCCWVFRDT